MILGVVVKGNWGCLSLQFQLILILVPIKGKLNCYQNVFICSNAPFVSREIISKEPNYKQSEHQREVLVLILALDY